MLLLLKTALKRLFDYTSLHFIFLNLRKNKKTTTTFSAVIVAYLLIFSTKSTIDIHHDTSYFFTPVRI